MYWWSWHPGNRSHLLCQSWAQPSALLTWSHWYMMHIPHSALATRELSVALFYYVFIYLFGIFFCVFSVFVDPDFFLNARVQDWWNQLGATCASTVRSARRLDSPSGLKLSADRMLEASRQKRKRHETISFILTWNMLETKHPLPQLPHHLISSTIPQPNTGPGERPHVLCQRNDRGVLLGASRGLRPSAASRAAAGPREAAGALVRGLHVSSGNDHGDVSGRFSRRFDDFGLSYCCLIVVLYVQIFRFITCPEIVFTFGFSGKSRQGWLEKRVSTANFCKLLHWVHDGLIFSLIFSPRAPGTPLALKAVKGSLRGKCSC